MGPPVGHVHRPPTLFSLCTGVTILHSCRAAPSISGAHSPSQHLRCVAETCRRPAGKRRLRRSQRLHPACQRQNHSASNGKGAYLAMSWTALLESVVLGADTVRSQVAGQSRLSAVSSTLSAQQLGEGCARTVDEPFLPLGPVLCCLSVHFFVWHWLPGVSSKQHHLLLHVLC